MPVNSDKSNSSIVFLSDTQSPFWLEKIRLESNDNEQARSTIFDRIQNIGPQSVFHLGDLVTFGFREGDWQEIDNFTDRLIEQNIPFYPILGNHELMIFSGSGRKKFEARYRSGFTSGYIVKEDNIAIIMLNSNFDDMTESQIDQQQVWYLKTLQECDKDQEIDAVIVASHHPPYTNSKIVDPNEDVQNYFVPGYFKSKKTKIFLSGHAHTFEHFKVLDKHFMVIGGAGGLQHPLLSGEEIRYHDQYTSSEELRPFHFLEITIQSGSLSTNVHMIESEKETMSISYQVIIPFIKKYQANLSRTHLRFSEHIEAF